MPRELLPNRRPCENIQFRLDGITYRATVGYHMDGRVAEIFLNGGKVGAQADIAMRDSAIVASFALQYGTPISAIRSGF